MKYNNIFSKIPVKVPNRTGHNLSHENLFTAKCGTLVPCHVEECYPNEVHSVDLSAQIQLPPFATDTYGQIDAVFETFFVPNRLLYGGWQEFITYQTENAIYPDDTSNLIKPKYLPTFTSSTASSSFNDLFGAGSLSDYLGNKFVLSENSSITVNNVLPFIAYHKIWDDWYRVSQVQRSCFTRSDEFPNNTINFQNIPYVSYGGNSPVAMSSSLLADLVSVFSLRQRSWAKDYFTNSTPLPQAGEPFSIKMSPDSNGDTTFNMNQLYALNALQQFSIRHNLAGNRYADNIMAFWGCYPSDAIVDRSLYLGRKIIPVYTKSVYQQNNGAAVSTGSNNPFNSVGSKFGSPMGVGAGNLVKSFKSTEHGFLITLFSLVPRPYYSSGQRRYLRRNKQSDYPVPILHGIGDQPIYQSELVNLPSETATNSTFGYTQYASEVKFHSDEVHGLLRDGESLDAFAIQRSFDNTQELGTDFLEIPTDFLDQITVISGDVSKYGCWVNAYFKYKKLSPFQPYSIPTLMDMQNTHTVVIDKGGKRL